MKLDVELLLIDLALILVLARLLGAAARAVGQPAVVGEILAGILLGPTLFHGAIKRHLFPPDLIPSLTAVADLGLVLFMFIVGYELDRALIKGRERIAATVSLGSIAVPMVSGFLLGLWLVSRHSGCLDRPVPAALFVGASMSVTAFPVLARILTDRGLHRTRVGGLAIASAAVDDIVAWSMLAVVVTIVGSEVHAGSSPACFPGSSPTHGAPQWHILLAPVYLAIMALVVRPLLRRVNDRYRNLGRLTPDLLAVVIIGLLLSSYATEWLGVHFIFGAFILGACMPREGGAPLRESILERLEQISVLVLLPVFFVVAGLAVDLSTFDVADAVELIGILGVAIGGKFLGAYVGAKASGVSGRQAGALATLMNTRGLTELVILTVGLNLHVLDGRLYSLMVLMAIVTTAMTGPLLRLIYPPRLVDRDLADAERAALAVGAAYRVLVVVESGDDTELVGTAVDLAAAHAPAQVLLARLLPQRPTDRLEVGSGLGSELLVMTKTLAELHALAALGAGRGVEVPVYTKFSEDAPADLTRLIMEVEPDLVLLGRDTQLAPHDFMPRIVRQRSAPPADATAVAVLQRGGGADEAAALQVAAQLAVSRGVAVVLAGVHGRRDRGTVADLARHGIRVVAGEVSDETIVVGTVDEPGTHLVARARPDDEADSIDDWAGALSAAAPAGGTS